MKLISISTQKDSCEQETYKSVPFLPKTSLSKNTTQIPRPLLVDKATLN